MRARRRHPAPFPRYVLKHLALHVRAEARALRRPVEVLDSFAGIGRIHDLDRRHARTTGIEIEAEWAACRRGTVVGDATQLPFAAASFDAWITSPCYANRLADHHDAKDSCAGCQGTGVTIDAGGCSEAPWCCGSCGRVDCVCGVLAKELREHNRRCPRCRSHICKGCGGAGVSKRYTYRHALGRMPHERSAATLQWSKAGGKYRAIQSAAISEAQRVLRPGGLVLLNLKNHLERDVEQLVCEWHAGKLEQVGFTVHAVIELPSPGLKHGAHAEKRVDIERVIVGRRP